MNLGNIFTPREITDRSTLHFKYEHFNLVFRYSDGLLNNYDSEIKICQQVVYWLQSNNILNDPDWIFSFNETLIAEDDYEGLICRKLGDKIQFGITGNYFGNSCYIEFPIDEIQLREKVAEFYNKIIDMLIEKRTNSIGASLKRWLF